MEALIGTIIGAIIALIGTWISTKHSTQAQMNAAVLSTVLPTRLDAYRRLHSAFSKWSSSVSADSYAILYQECDAALLVASEETTIRLRKVINVVKNFELMGSVDLTQFRDLYGDLIKGMNHDLMYIQAPKIEESKG